MLTVSAGRAEPRCRHIAGSETVVKRGARVLFGEMHGNAETPALVADVTCEAAKAGPVRVALEIPGDEQERIDRSSRPQAPPRIAASSSKARSGTANLRTDARWSDLVSPVH
jgi:hypothetical protein